MDNRNTVTANKTKVNNHNNPYTLEMGWVMALNSERPKAFKNPNRWITPCITKTIIKATRMIFLFLM
ncbi:hypothetical protein CQA01_21690 [Cyclobacterium qasimii]|uniref:Uncharacterized protein n=1 Tax=Cyclobacterium qasimii TaxID=1350429 RepID=A0A512CBV0_9BACT|nr:hypothetical protein CQA01_21690 [Cyclobacterium qasimii]